MVDNSHIVLGGNLEHQNTIEAGVRSKVDIVDLLVDQEEVEVNKVPRLEVRGYGFQEQRWDLE